MKLISIKIEKPKTTQLEWIDEFKKKFDRQPITRDTAKDMECFIKNAKDSGLFPDSGIREIKDPITRKSDFVTIENEIISKMRMHIPDERD